MGAALQNKTNIATIENISDIILNDKAFAIKRTIIKRLFSFIIKACN